MRRAAGKMHEARKEHRDCVVVAAKAKHAYKLAYARAFLTSGGTVDQRKAISDAATEKELLAHELSEGLERSALEACRNTRSEVDMWRSYVAASRDGTATQWAMAEHE